MKLLIIMLMIIMSHFAWHNAFDFETNDISISKIWYSLLIMGGETGTNVFVLISGYFLTSKEDKVTDVKHLVKLWGNVVFYSLILYFLYIIIGRNQFNIVSFAKAFFPITSEQWWFASTYFVLYLLNPYINKLLLCLTKRAFQRLLVLLFICWSIIPTITNTEFQSNNLLWFVSLFCLAAYIKLYGLFPRISCKRWCLLFVISTGILLWLSIVIMLVGVKLPEIGTHYTYFYDKQSFPLLIRSLCLFMAFLTLTIRPHQILNKIASTTFGIYLLHEYPLSRSLLWDEVFQNVKWQHSNYVVVYSIGVSMIIFAVGMGIDFARQYFFERPFLRASSGVLNNIHKKHDCKKDKV